MLLDALCSCHFHTYWNTFSVHRELAHLDKMSFSNWESSILRMNPSVDFTVLFVDLPEAQVLYRPPSSLQKLK